MATLEQLLIAAQNADGKAQRGKHFLRKRSGTELTREQVKAIKKGRKLLRKEMKAKGLKEKSDFELTATSMGLYFDKHRFLLWLQWFFHGAGLLRTLIVYLRHLACDLNLFISHSSSPSLLLKPNYPKK